jgi:MFS family permease
MLIIRLRALPAPAWALFAGAFINRFGSFVLPFLTLYLTHEGYPLAQVGLVVGAYGVGSIIASALGGYFADRIGRRATITFSMFASAVTMLTLAQAHNLLLLALLTGLAGLMAESYRPAAGALLADLIPQGQRVTGFAVYRLAINVGVALGVALAGFLADHSFGLLFVGDALTSICFGVIAWLALPAYGSDSIEQNTAAHSSAEESRTGMLRALSMDWRFLLFLLASVLASFVYFQSLSTLGLQVRASGFPNAVYGGLLSLNALIVMLFELPLTSITQRLPAYRMMALGTWFVALGFGLTAFAQGLPVFTISVLLWTLGEMLNSPVASAHVADIAPAHLRGQYQGAWGVMGSAGLILAPVLGTRLFAWNAAGLWLLCGLLGTLSAAIIFFSQRHARTATAK